MVWSIFLFICRMVKGALKMIDNTSLVGLAFNSFERYITGDMFLTLLLLFGLFLLFGIVFRIPLTWLAILLVPISLYFMSLDSRFYAPGSIVLLFVAFVIIKNFWIKPT